MKRVFSILILSLFLSLLPSCDDSSDNNGNNTNNINNNNNNENNNNNNTAGSPSVFSLSPSKGPVTGGTEVTIYGKNFTEDIQVYLGNNQTEAEYINSSSVKITTPAVSNPGPADVRVVQSSGEYTLSGGFTYEAAETPITISWCNFQAPASVEINKNNVTPALYGRVYAEGFTDQPGQGTGITAQAGFGPVGSDPASDASWIWVNATYNVDTGDGANDEYSAVLNPATAGDYDMAFRFNGGEDWIYCDLNGSDDGYTSDNAAKLTVSEQTQPQPDWCILQYPATLDGTPLSPTEAIYGRVFVNGVTDSAGQGSDIIAQVGFGPSGTHPGADPGWQWTDATFNADTDNTANDEYSASLLVAQPGIYAYAYRFSYMNGPWIYCDLNGSDDGYAPDFQGTLSIEGTSEATEIDWCNIQYPANTSAEINTDSPLFYGRVFVNGVTPGNGQGQGITAELGFGPTGSDPSLDNSGWSFTPAAYNVSVDGISSGDLANDEYMASLNIAVAGTYSVVFRFSRDGGNTWKYCDLDGSDNGFDASGVSVINVTETAAQSVDWCIFQYPSSLTFTPGSPTENLYGRVFMSGVTEGAGEGPGITAQIGFGPENTNPGDASDLWTFADAAYNVSVDGLVSGDLANDEYMGTLTIPATGVYSLAYRFSADGGISWTYCDSDGSDNGFDPAQLPSATSAK